MGVYSLEFKAAVLIVYDLPHNLVRSHSSETSILSERRFDDKLPEVYSVKG
jgi:hypothetical protein